MKTLHGQRLKRFYTAVSVEPAEGGFGVRLDARAVRTPAGRALHLPTDALARAVAAEWDAQGEHIDPRAMPLTRLANTALDRVAPDPAPVLDALMGYGASDLLCYRADAPEGLVRAQGALWQPVLGWLAEAYGARLRVGIGITPVAQPEAELIRLRTAFERRPPFALAALQEIAGCLGSAVLALALADGRLDAEGAWAAARVDEDWQIAQWGEDAEEAARVALVREAHDAAARFLALGGPATGSALS